MQPNNALHSVDDVEDDSQLRRGLPGLSHPSQALSIFADPDIVAHKIYGVPQTINTANYVYFLAYQELFKLRELVLADESSDTGPTSPIHTLERIVTGTFLFITRIESSLICL